MPLKDIARKLGLGRNLIIVPPRSQGSRDWPSAETSSIDWRFPNIFGIDPFDAGASTEIGYLIYLKNGGTLEKGGADGEPCPCATTQLYDRRAVEVTLDEVERVLI